MRSTGPCGQTPRAPQPSPSPAAADTLTTQASKKEDNQRQGTRADRGQPSPGPAFPTRTSPPPLVVAGVGVSAARLRGTCGRGSGRRPRDGFARPPGRDSDNLSRMTAAAPLSADELSPVLAPYLSLLGALRQGALVDGERTRLVEAAVEMWSRPGFDTFLSQPMLSFEPFDY